jgi:hypothetical protein
LRWLGLHLIHHCQTLFGILGVLRRSNIGIPLGLLGFYFRCRFGLHDWGWFLFCHERVVGTKKP